MSYLVIIVFLIICILTSVFLIKESYSSRKATRISIIIGVMSSIITILSFLLTEKYSGNDVPNSINFIGNSNTISISDEINTEIIINKLSNSLIIFDDIPCYIMSKNFDDTKINNDKTELTFFNHPEKLTELNKLSFSFMLGLKYNLLSTSIYVKDNIETDNDHYTSIQIFADDNLIYSSENLYSSSLPLQINLDLKDIYILSFSISTNMIDEKEEVIRTITFSETNIQ